MVEYTYILKGKTPVPSKGILYWCKWMASADRYVNRTNMAPHIEVSTVFVGIDSSFGERKPPLLFETMIFGGAHDGFKKTYATWKQAEVGHELTVKMLLPTIFSTS